MRHIHRSRLLFVVAFMLIITASFPPRSTAQNPPGQWAWMGGPQGVSSARGVYGTEYQFGAGTRPGARSASTTWTDAQGRFWLFGGEGTDRAGTYGLLNDLWVFDPAKGAHGQWAWMGGSATAQECFAWGPCTSTPAYGTEYQFSDGNVPGGRMWSARWTDKSGRIWIYGGYGRGSYSEQGLADLWVFDPSAGAHGQWAWMGGSNITSTSTPPVHGAQYEFADTNNPGSVFNGTSWTDGNGKFWLFGSDMWLFDPAQGAHGEWAWMGSSDTVWGTKYQFAPDNFPGSRWEPATWTDSSGNLWLFGGERSQWGDDRNDLWVFDATQGAHGEWAWMGGTKNLNTPGVYGAEYAFSPSNLPGGRAIMTTWLGKDGKLWLLGGLGHDEIGNRGDLDDLWVFDPARGAHGEWAWMGGDTQLGCNNCDGRPNVYGTEYEFSGSNHPGGRQSNSSWTDKDGNLWLATGTQDEGWSTSFVFWSFDDMWEFRLLTPQTISFPAFPHPLTYGAAPITLGATASSGLPLTYKLKAGPGTLSTDSNNHTTLTITGAGAAVVVNAYQAGDSTFAQAPVATQGTWISRAPLTVTADNKTMTYGQPIPALTWTPTGFVNGDTASFLTGAPTLSTAATSTSRPGTYGILIAANTLSAANYVIGPKRGTITIQPLGTVATPKFSLSTGTYMGPQSVRIFDGTTGALFFYTTDGSTPTSSHGTKYAGPITVGASETIKAIAVKAGYTPSTVISATYTIQ